MRARVWGSVLLVIASAGCSLQPDRAPPEIAVPPAFKHDGPWRNANPSDREVRGSWWEAFGDPLLNDLVVRIDAANPTLEAALANRDRALAAMREAGADRLPTITATAQASRERLSGGRPIGPGVPIETNQYLAGASLAYEIDLWGRVRNAVAASRADASAAEANVEAVRLSLRATLADTYFRLRGLDAEQALLQRTVAAYERASRLIGDRYDVGIASGVDRSRAASQLADARARAEAIAGERAALEHSIAILVGEVPSSFGIERAEQRVSLPRFTPGVPSALLERRPDIARAQRELSAANARIGVARAALYPDLTLGLSGGVQAVQAPIFSAPNTFWALGPLSSLAALFDGGRRRARVDISEAAYRRLAADYRATVLDAFREVEDALARTNALERQSQQQSQAATAAARTEELALIRYRDGAADYLDVVTAQTAALNAQQASIDVQVNRQRAVIALVRAVGGGYSETRNSPSSS
ncbi:efflux transporter outer membrane subunit [Sphingobium olei]|uniref:Efflux transporter outer membrane subunit n=1 Tax=Sphingobium olei TaxID=420955 RepID=A0ABW3NYN0_9SPHN